eukprot:scaffold22291_cov32-Tisochrysis_lutea.AAC.2
MRPTEEQREGSASRGRRSTRLLRRLLVHAASRKGCEREGRDDDSVLKAACAVLCISTQRHCTPLGCFLAQGSKGVAVLRKRRRQDYVPARSTRPPLGGP